MPGTLIVVTGRPASGKSRLTRIIQPPLRLGVLSKDDIKEALADSLPVRNREASQALGRAAMNILWQLAERTLPSSSVIVEANFDRDLASPRVNEVLARTSSLVIQIVLRCPDDIVRARYAARLAAEERHPVHMDGVVLQEWDQRGVPDVEPLDVPGTVIELASTEMGLHLAPLVNRLLSAIQDDSPFPEPPPLVDCRGT